MYLATNIRKASSVKSFAQYFEKSIRHSKDWIVFPPSGLVSGNNGEILPVVWIILISVGSVLVTVRLSLLV